MNKVQYDAGRLKGKTRFEWEQTVAATINKLWASYTGRNMLDELGRSPKIVTIVPEYDGEQNAGASPNKVADSYYPGRPVRDDDGKVMPTAGTGTGRGSDVTLGFTPWRFPELLQPVVLIHELTHSAEQQRGMDYSNTMHSACFDSVSEFDAILVENIYRSEQNMDLRKDHHGVRRLEGNKMLPQPGELKARIDSFKARMPHLAKALAGVNVPFNPLRPGNPAAV